MLAHAIHAMKNTEPIEPSRRAKPNRVNRTKLTDHFETEPNRGIHNKTIGEMRDPVHHGCFSPLSDLVGDVLRSTPTVFLVSLVSRRRSQRLEPLPFPRHHIVAAEDRHVSRWGEAEIRLFPGTRPIPGFPETLPYNS